MNSKISMNTKILWLSNVNCALIGRNKLLSVIVFTGVNGICYWIFLMTIACHSINSGTFYFFTRQEGKIGFHLFPVAFSDTGKEISKELCNQIAARVKDHPYYVQQLSQQVWLRTEKKCTDSILDEAFLSLTGQLSLLFANIIDTLTSKQIIFYWRWQMVSQISRRKMFLQNINWELLQI